MATEILSWKGPCLFRLVNSAWWREQRRKITVSPYPLIAKQGSILIVVLWALFFLSMLAVAIGAYIRPQLALANKLKDRARMYYLAKAGVKRAILEITKDETDAYDALKELWKK